MESDVTELVPRPTASRPDTLWTQHGAQIAWGALVVLAQGDASRSALSLAAVLGAHRPKWQPPVGSWIRGDPGTPGYASCGGDCWGDGKRDAPAPWPCPAIRPMLNALEVAPRA